MKSSTKKFREIASSTVSDPKIQDNLGVIYNRFHKAREIAIDKTPDWDKMSDQARAIKAHTIDHLDYYLEIMEKNVTKSGGNVFFATDASSASQYILDIANRGRVRSVIKSKSMLSEEMGLNAKLEDAGMEVVETDLGEYLIQLRDETPYHIIAPALHMSGEDASETLSDTLGTPINSAPEDLVKAVRVELRDKFIRAGMGITGGNFVVAETGSLVLVTNEGNGRMCTSMPRIHVAIVGMEKIIPSMADLGIFLRLLIRSATGQRLSSYVTTVTGPRRIGETDGPDEFHLVIVDNGRSKILADPQMREALYCLRCGACLNACPVYRKVGGHSYGWVYSGPIGAVISPILTNLPDSKDLPYASSLCGACREACPVKINIPRMLLKLRNELVEGGTHSKVRTPPIIEVISMRVWRWIVSSNSGLYLANIFGRIGQMFFARGDTINWLPPPLTGWTKYRKFPRIVSRPFRSRWNTLMRDRD